MHHLRLLVPEPLCQRVLDLLSEQVSVVNIARFPNAAVKPRGDVVTCDVATEDTSVILEELRAIHLHRTGSIAVDPIALSLSDAATAAERAAAGTPADAVIWESVESTTSDAAELNASFVSFLTLATLIAATGILTDSVVLIIGAMVVGPEFGPLAGVCVAAVQKRLSLAWRSLLALLVGFPIAIVATWWLVLGLRALELTPAALTRNQTLFISHPDAYSLIVALLAGVAGMLSLSTAKSGALIGVLISVTTVPAAANIGVAAAYADRAELIGAALQLLVNVGAVIVAGIVTLAIQRALFVRRLKRSRVWRRLRSTIDRVAPKPS